MKWRHLQLVLFVIIGIMLSFLVSCTTVQETKTTDGIQDTQNSEQGQETDVLDEVSEGKFIRKTKGIRQSDGSLVFVWDVQ